MVENILLQAARFSSGIWSMHYEKLAEKIRSFEPPKAEAGMVSAPLGYEPDPSKTLEAITRDHAEADVSSLNDLSNSWSEGLFKGGVWWDSTERLLNTVYLSLFSLLKQKADLMTVGAVDVYARALRQNINVLNAFSLMRNWRGRPRDNFLKLTKHAALIHGMHLFNLSLGRLYIDIFRSSKKYAAEALLSDETCIPKLKQWAFVHRRKGFYSTKYHRELDLMMLGSVEENFARMEKAGDIDKCMQVIRHLRKKVALSETDYIAQHARLQLICDLAIRATAIISDEAVCMTLNEWRAKAEKLKNEIENDLSPFPGDIWERKRPSGGTVELISSAPGWRGPSDHDDDPSPAT
jgi:hypothetical protein